MKPCYRRKNVRPTQLFWGYDKLQVSVPVFDQFLVAKTCSRIFFGNFRIEILNVVIRTPKRHVLHLNYVFCISVSVYIEAVASCGNPKQRQKLYSHKITYIVNRKPWTDRDKITSVRWCPWRNYACQFWRRSVKGFWRGEGSNFGLFHWLASSPLQHFRNTVQVCDSLVNTAVKFHRQKTLWRIRP